jgi:hypothetical protein
MTEQEIPNDETQIIDESVENPKSEEIIIDPSEESDTSEFDNNDDSPEKDDFIEEFNLIPDRSLERTKSLIKYVYPDLWERKA